MVVGYASSVSLGVFRLEAQAQQRAWGVRVAIAATSQARGEILHWVKRNRVDWNAVCVGPVR
jgi:hypothetical protein